jgi:hypothetical protein
MTLPHNVIDNYTLFGHYWAGTLSVERQTADFPCADLRCGCFHVGAGTSHISLLRIHQSICSLR